VIGRLSAAAWLCCAGPLLGGAVVAGDGLAVCDQKVRARPDDYYSFHCYLDAARSERRWDDAVRRLEGLLAIDPANTFARVVLARVENDRGAPRAEALFRQAASEFAARKMPVGEVFARLDLAFLLRRFGRLPDAASEVAAARSTAESAGVPMLLTNVLAEEGWIAYTQGDYTEALARFRSAETRSGAQGPWLIRASILSGLGSTLWAVGEDRQSYDAYVRLVEGHHQRNESYAEARQLYNLALLAQRLAATGAAAPAEWRELMHRALALAVSTGNRDAEGSVRLSLAMDPLRSLPERLADAEAALRLGRESVDQHRLCAALREVAHLRSLSDPVHAEATLPLAEEAVARARAVGDPQGMARGIIRLAETRWKIGPPERALADSLEALDAIERIRELQRDDLVRARLGSEWTFYYYSLIRKLLHREPASEADRELAFQIGERLRGRVLLDRLDAARATGAGGDSELHRRRREVLEQIGVEQARLQSSLLAEVDLQESLRALETLEQESTSLGDELARVDPAFARLRRPVPPSIAETLAALGPDEAMLVFLLASQADDPIPGESDYGGSWIFALSREGATVYALPDEEEIAASVGMFLGMIERRDGSEESAGVRLYDDLLRDALAGLPEGVTRLVVVPDRSVFRLPLEALRPGPGEQPLGASHEIALAPSAALWLRARRAAAGAGGDAALIVADPETPTITEESARERGPEGAAGLGPLPHARREGRVVLREFGGRGEVRVGSEATERGLKQADWSRYRLLHLAVHAIVDEAHPEQSALLLTAGGGTEDGLLRMDEVAALGLNGQVVVLPACRSAGGRLLRGEGVLSIARAFFQAGAHDVVGSLWRMRDAEAEPLVTAFYRGIGRGESVGAALRAARRERIAAGAPVAAWAGFELFGDGATIPLPGGRPRWPTALPVAATLMVLGLGFAAAFRFWRRTG